LSFAARVTLRENPCHLSNTLAGIWDMNACAVYDDIRRRRARAEIMGSPWNRARQHGKHPGFAGSIILAFLSRCGEFV
jgi:hypothetical protein